MVPFSDVRTPCYLGSPCRLSPIPPAYTRVINKETSTETWVAVCRAVGGPAFPTLEGQSGRTQFPSVLPSISFNVLGEGSLYHTLSRTLPEQTPVPKLT